MSTRFARTQFQNLFVKLGAFGGIARFAKNVRPLQQRGNCVRSNCQGLSQVLGSLSVFANRGQSVRPKIERIESFGGEGMGARITLAGGLKLFMGMKYHAELQSAIGIVGVRLGVGECLL